MALTLLLLELGLQSAPATTGDTAVLRIGNRAVAVFRGPLGAATPEERAAGALRRVGTALAARRDSVATRSVAEGILVLLGGQPVFTITPTDADTAGGGSIPAAAEQAAAQLRLAVAEARESRSLRVLIRDLSVALGATAVMLLAIRLLFSSRRRLRARLARWDVPAAPEIMIPGLRLIHPRQLALAARALVTVAAWGLGLMVGYLYLTFVLSQFPLTRPLGEALGQILLQTLGQLITGALGTIPGLFVVAVIFAVTRFLMGLVRTTFDAVEQGRLAIPGIHPDTAPPTRRIAMVLVWLFAIVVAYPYVPGSGSAAFKGVSVFAGLLISLGSAGLV